MNDNDPPRIVIFPKWNSATQPSPDVTILVREQGQKVPHWHVRFEGPENLSVAGVQGLTAHPLQSEVMASIVGKIQNG